MFFLGASANILIYLLFPAFLGVFLYSQEKSVPADYLASFSVVEFSEEIQNSYECSTFYEEIPSGTETIVPQIKIGIQSSCYISPHYRNCILYKKNLRAPPVLVF